MLLFPYYQILNYRLELPHLIVDKQFRHSNSMHLNPFYIGLALDHKSADLFGIAYTLFDMLHMQQHHNLHQLHNLTVLLGEQVELRLALQVHLLMVV